MYYYYYKYVLLIIIRVMTLSTCGISILIAILAACDMTWDLGWRSDWRTIPAALLIIFVSLVGNQLALMAQRTMQPPK